MAPGSLKFLAIAVEHSTKWVEAKPLTIENGRQAEKFIWEHVICRFKVPQTITSKNEKKFTEGDAKSTRMEAIIPTATSLTPEREGSISREKAKRKEGEERQIASIEEAYDQNKL
ncbi:reverse transcriptase domain-containing protein [Tanacetum coccineum]|uniref:Reverse transcriptase domain-containing protein n=1 Tax=Tanacetum coccineum TaxID=301880 RepID=A0ABQ5F5I2_9ASTR